VVSGFVKTMGAIAAVFAVDPHPDPVSILILFSCFFFWEIGGQNIPHDWSDIEEDRRFEAKTIPVQMGEERSAALSFACVLLAAILCTILFFIKFSSMRGPALTAALAVCGVLLLAPGWRLFQTRSRASAMALFNRASYFPAALLGAVLILIMS
jgi:4-hydroxybenzoate polyprenyltransferase